MERNRVIVDISDVGVMGNLPSTHNNTYCIWKFGFGSFRENTYTSLDHFFARMFRRYIICHEPLAYSSKSLMIIEYIHTAASPQKEAGERFLASGWSREEVRANCDGNIFNTHIILRRGGGMQSVRYSFNQTNKNLTTLVINLAYLPIAMTLAQ